MVPGGAPLHQGILRLDGKLLFQQLFGLKIPQINNQQFSLFKFLEESTSFGALQSTINNENNGKINNQQKGMYPPLNSYMKQACR